jgi:cyclophilin family peptidyl-prolyl cis-trans isomerase
MNSLFAVAALAAAIAPWQGQDASSLRLREAILVAEDARPRDSAGLESLLAGLRSSDSVAQRLGVRGLGRLERQDLAAAIGWGMSAPAPGVRAEAANALAQSAVRGDGAEARRLLQIGLLSEKDQTVRGVILRSLGRLPVPADEMPSLERVLAASLASNPTEPAVLAGAANGLASLYRRHASRRPPSDEAIRALAAHLDQARPVQVRRLAAAALAVSGRVDSTALGTAMRDPDREVRRLAVSATGSRARMEGREGIIARGLGDRDAGVRVEALRAGAGPQPTPRGCATIQDALRDADPQVRLVAIDLLAGCGPEAASPLREIARRPMTEATWHEPAHALVALARVAPRSADSLFAGFVTYPIWRVRMYAALASHAVPAAGVLEALAGDRHPNVLEAALTGLRALRGHAADRHYLAALAAADYQLLLTAAQALDSSPDPVAVPALLDALKRVTDQRRETSRDVRMAMLRTLEHIAGPAHSTALEPYLADFDPAIASQVAAMLSRWTGTARLAEPRPLPEVVVPHWAALEAMARLRPVLVMRGGGRVVLRLRPFDAPTNVARFVRMARAGWFDGLTFHRVVPNFVVQGGSPGANEYMGDGPFSRDEVDLASHGRGTVGISTRGRDTGDGQLFINLVDNIRLDHDYTIIAEVVDGMDVVDAMLEGAVIERVEWTPEVP